MPDTPRKTAQDFDPAVMRLFDQYVHGLIDRRGFLKGTSALAISTAAATGMLAALTPDFAAAQQVKPDDARLEAEFVAFDSPAGYGKGRGYLVRPAGASGPLPLVLVVHENRGLNPHIEDITRRLALAGYLAFAPDALFPLGGYPGDEDSARTLFQQLDQAKTREDMVAAAGFLAGVEGGNGRMGAIGFCYGGAIANFLATRLPDLQGVRAVLRQRRAAGGRGEDQGGTAGGAGVGRRARQRRLARLRRGTEGGRRHLPHDPAARTRCTASTTTPRRATTRPRRPWPGARPWPCSNARCAAEPAQRGARIPARRGCARPLAVAYLAGGSMRGWVP